MTIRHERSYPSVSGSPPPPPLLIFDGLQLEHTHVASEQMATMTQPYPPSGATSAAPSVGSVSGAGDPASSSEACCLPTSLLDLDVCNRVVESAGVGAAVSNVREVDGVSLGV